MDGICDSLAMISDRENYHVVGQVLAGHSYDNTLQAGEAVRIIGQVPPTTRC